MFQDDDDLRCVAGLSLERKLVNGFKDQARVPEGNHQIIDPLQYEASNSQTPELAFQQETGCIVSQVYI